MRDDRAVAAALRQIAKGFDALAAALDDEASPSASARELAVLRSWGDAGLDRAQASALFRQHGIAPQAIGGWVRGDWIELRADGRRYLTARSRTWMEEQP